MQALIQKEAVSGFLLKRKKLKYMYLGIDCKNKDFSD